MSNRAMSWGCFLVFSIVCGGFAYFYMACQVDAKDVKFGPTRGTTESAATNPTAVAERTSLKVTPAGTAPTPVQGTGDIKVKSAVLNPTKKAGAKSGREKVQNTGIITPEFYLSQMTSFYGLIISLLLAIIAIILGVSFLYLHFVSKSRTEEMARDALNEEAFRIVLGKMVNDCFTKSKNEGDIAELFSMPQRVGFLEKAITEDSYGQKRCITEKERKDGDN